MKLLDSPVAIVTGGSSGNGRATALALARHGASCVIIADLRDSPREGGEATHLLIEAETNARSIYVPCDLSGPLTELENVAAVAAQFGGASILVNNAGVYWDEDYLDATPEKFDWMMQVNVRSPYFLTQAVVRQMVERGSGCVINVTSGVATVGSSRRSSYGTSKGALLALTYALAAEMGPKGIRFNSVMPGSIRTAMTTIDVPAMLGDGEQSIARRIPLRRVGKPDDVANTIVYLCSSLASFVNATNIDVDGGELNTVDFS